MLANLRAALLVPDIRKRVGFVLFAFAVFIFMIHVQLPDVNKHAWQSLLKAGTFYNFLGFLSGGALQELSIIAMGITPYINASIIMQLMTVVLPQLEEMAKKGGEEGRKRISQYTRWLTIGLAFIQAWTMSSAMERGGVFYDTSPWFFAYAVIAMVSGTLFLMWLGEQITDKGIGNGVSLIIFIGIVLRYPTSVSETIAAGQFAGHGLNILLFLAVALVTIVSIIFMYQGQRRVPVQQARRVVGRKMFAGRSSYIPLRLNNAGVISIIFAISILLLPQQALSWFTAVKQSVVVQRADAAADDGARNVFSRLDQRVHGKAITSYTLRQIDTGVYGLMPRAADGSASAEVRSDDALFHGMTNLSELFTQELQSPTFFTLLPKPLPQVQVPTNMPALALSLQTHFGPTTWEYNAAYFFLVCIFTFFYSAIVVNTRDISDNLKKSGSFIPGIRPGQPTVDYLNKILLRITTVAAVYLGVLAILPSVVQHGLQITTLYFGSTSLLIVVGVALDTMTQIEARLAMRDYKGFMGR